jgi:hypothetical protein
MVDFLTVKNQNNPLSVFSPHPAHLIEGEGKKNPHLALFGNTAE